MCIRDSTNGVGYDVWVTLCQNGINDNPDQDDITDPYYYQDGKSAELSRWYWYNDMTSFLTPGHRGVYLQGPAFTGDSGLPGGRYWRAAVKIGLVEGQWFNANLVGNMERNPAYMDNMDGRGLRAKVCETMADSKWYGAKHMGLIAFVGYPSDPIFPLVKSIPHGPPRNRWYSVKPYNPVMYSPLQVSLYYILYKPLWDLGVPDRELRPLCLRWSSEIIQSRYGGHDRAAHGHPREDRFRPGWRADGASYYAVSYTHLTLPTN